MRSIGAALVVLMTGTAGLAQDAPLIGPATLKVFPRGEERCFAGTFDAAYRRSHAGQTLAQFLLYRHFQQNQAKEDPGQTPAERIAEDVKPDAPGWVEVLSAFSGQPGSFRQTVSCNDKDTGGLHCAVECDGGSFDVDPRSDRLKISFDPKYGAALSLNQGCGDPDEEGSARMLTAKDAGGGFAIHPAPVSQCVAADAAAHPAFANDPVPLRERARSKAFRCLKRVYDKAYLKAHPKQRVVAVAVAIAGDPHEVNEEGMRPSIGLDVRLSLKLRKGKTARRTVTCSADGYLFRCGGEFRLRRRDAASATLLSGEYGGEEQPQPATLAGLALGSDDRAFRLDTGGSAPCNAE